MMADQALSDRYQIQQQLAKKAGRRTLLARDLQTEALVIVKLLSFSSDFEWDDFKLFELEKVGISIWVGMLRYKLAARDLFYGNMSFSEKLKDVSPLTDL